MHHPDLQTNLAHPATTTIEIPIAWGEMDALGHVNNAVFFRYIESARIDFLRKSGSHALRDETGIGFILQFVEMRFRQPLVFPDTIRVDTKLVSIEEDRFTLGHAVVSRKSGEVSAIGRGTIVTFDYSKNVKVAVPGAIREAILAMAKRAN
ncbi:MAG: acyl-CoA thioesterase [Phycisphaeraceae bacterium]|nr:acyl-CoA thioesterase [Phycisphaeraceae bacterium]